MSWDIVFDNISNWYCRGFLIVGWRFRALRIICIIRKCFHRMHVCWFNFRYFRISAAVTCVVLASPKRNALFLEYAYAHNIEFHCHRNFSNLHVCRTIFLCCQLNIQANFECNQKLWHVLSFAGFLLHNHFGNRFGCIKRSTCLHYMIPQSNSVSMMMMIIT